MTDSRSVDGKGHRAPLLRKGRTPDACSQRRRSTEPQKRHRPRGSGLRISTSSTEYPNSNQKNEAEDHHDETGIKHKNELVLRIELLESLPYPGTLPQVGNSLVLRQKRIYLANHDERNHIGKHCCGGPEADYKDNRP
jgi:hypothetical protein